MNTLPIYSEILFALAGAAVGWTYGIRLYASGVHVQARLALRDLPLLSFLTFLFVGVNAFFIVATQVESLPWRLPIVIERYQPTVRWACDVAVMAFIFTTVASAAWRDSKRLGAVLMLVGAAALVAGHVVAYKTGRPVELPRTRVTPEGAVLQTTGSTCAAAAGASVARLFGVRATEALMVRLMGTTDDGTSEVQIVDGMAKVGLTAARRHVRDCDIRKVKAPALLMIDLYGGPNGHCVAFLGMQGEKAEILDPSCGPLLNTPDELRKRWRGWAFEISKKAAPRE